MISIGKYVQLADPEHARRKERGYRSPTVRRAPTHQTSLFVSRGSGRSTDLDICKASPEG